MTDFNIVISGEFILWYLAIGVFVSIANGAFGIIILKLKLPQWYLTVPAFFIVALIWPYASYKLAQGKVI